MDRLGASVLVSGVQTAEPFISPDGRWVGFYSENALMKVPVDGGAPVSLCAAPSNFGDTFGASWEEDDTILFGRGSEGIWRVSAAGGTPSRVIEVDGGEAYGPQAFPGGEWVLYTWRPPEPGASWDDAHIVAQSLATGERELLPQRAREARYLSSGHLVYVRDGVVYGAPFDTRRRALDGEPERLLEGVDSGRGGSAAAQVRITNDGTLVYVPAAVGRADEARRLVRVDRDGNQEVMDRTPGPYLGVTLSPDGARAALGTDSGENRDVWVTELDRGAVIRVSTADAPDDSPTFTPDGNFVVFSSFRDGQSALYRRAADGTGQDERLFVFDGSPEAHPGDWTRDGKGLLLTLFQRSGDRDIGVLRLDGDGEPSWEPLLDGPESESYPSLSPDCGWIAYDSQETGQSEVYVLRFPELGERRPISIGGGCCSAWSTDGSELYYLRLAGAGPLAVMRVAIDQDGTTLRVAQPEELFPWSFHQRNRPSRRYGGLAGRPLSHGHRVCFR